MADPISTAELSTARTADGTLLVRLAGDWRLRDRLPSAAGVFDDLGDPAVKRLAFDAAGLGDWDSGLLILLRRLSAAGAERDVTVDLGGLPAGVRRLLEIASEVPEAPARHPARRSWLAAVGESATGAARTLPEALRFVGEVTLAALRLAGGKVRFRRVDFWWTMQQVGVQALPIVGLLSFLIGLILAYVGAVQLRQFGAQIYVADLVGLAVAREMGPMMTGIILAGRTGAAFAASIGSMQANEEIDALKTLAIPPIDFLVLPRMLALVLMMPALCLYADLLGILGGAAIGVLAMDLGAVEYYEQSRAALELADFGVGLFKGSVFGVMVALAGCFHGIRCGRSSAAVGAATTAAVVTGIVLIIVSDAALTVIVDILGF